MREHVNDPWVQRAKAEGWRSRAAFKLMEIDDKDKLIRRGAIVVDLGCTPGGSDRGSHAHKNLHQFIVAMSGSFDVVLNDGREAKRFHLNRSYNGLYVCPMMWRDLDNFSSGSVCMVLASERYDENDYIRDYQEFLEMVNL